MMLMRMWHYKILKYLPSDQLKGQLRELIAIMHRWRDDGFPRHMLVNIITEYPKSHFYTYFKMFQSAYEERFRKTLNPKWEKEFIDFCSGEGDLKLESSIYSGWHNEEYLKICMANLYEKYRFSFMSNGKLCCSEWQELLHGYRYITGEEYKL